ncbi:MAG: hypothetical protein RL701_3983 [Pseudomonadota bacterium]
MVGLDDAMTETPRQRRFAKYRELLRARWSLSAALGTFALGIFLRLTSVLRAGGLQVADQRLLDAIIAQRIPSLNASALELTALGSGTVITLIVIVALFFLQVGRDARGALQLLVASVGAWLATDWLKRMLVRERPNLAQGLTEVSSFSFPSGHAVASAAVYLTLVLVLSRHVPTAAGRAGAFGIALLLTAVIGFSRAYIGVHFPSDIAAGLAFGWGWALLVHSVFSYINAKSEAPTPST